MTIPIFVPVSALCAAATLSFFMLAEHAREGSRSDWLVFGGALISSLLVIAAIATYFSSRGLRDQISAALHSRKEDRIEADLPGLQQAETLLIAYLNELRDLDECLTDSVGEWESRINALSRTVPKTVAHELPNATAKTRQDVTMTLNVFSGTALGLVVAHRKLNEAKGEEPDPISQNILSHHERELERRRARFRTAQGIAESRLKVITLQERLIIYRRETEPVLPA